MELQDRKKLRLVNYDYSSQNYYFVTICTHDKKCIFGKPNILNEYGIIAAKEIENISNHFERIKVDKYVIMPNHIHAIIIIGCDGTLHNNSERSRPFPTLSSIIGLYKSGVSKHIHKLNVNINVWQKYYYDHIIRNKNDYENIWNYIENNPIKWEEDSLYICNEKM